MGKFRCQKLLAYCLCLCTLALSACSLWGSDETPSASTYTISGTATYKGSALADATITLSGAGSGVTTTDAGGNYTFASRANGSYTITPSKSGYTFTPNSLAVTVNGADQTGQNFSATLNETPTYTISGTVTHNGSALADATISLSGAGSGTTSTDASGNYTFASLANGAYTVAPSKSGYTFTPSSLAVTVNGADQTGQNFSATLTATPTYSISGTATYNGSALADATITLSGAGSGTTTTDAAGNYTFASLANGNYTVTPSKTGYTFTPGNLAVTVNGANQTGQNFSAALTVVPTYAISGTTTYNGNGLANATITLSGAASAVTTTDASGNYSFTSLANGDYTITPSKLNYAFSPSNAAVTVNGANQTGKNFSATVSFSDASLSGDYALATYVIDSNTLPVTRRGSYLTNSTINGAGSYTRSTVYSKSDAGAPLTESATGTYTVATDGTTQSIENGGPTDGSLNADGDVFVLAEIRDPNTRSIALGVKKGASGFANSSLNGKYYCSGIGQNNTNGAPAVMIGAFNFDGVGNWTFSGTLTILGGAANVGKNGLGTYSVNPDGTFILNGTMTMTDGVPIRGVIKDTGDVLLLSAVDDVTEQFIIYAVKAGGNTYSNASLNGTYFLNYIELDSTGNYTQSCIGTFTFNGSGSYSGTSQCSPSTGTTPGTDSLSGTYSVNPDGTFTFTSGPFPYDGAISQDGNSVVHASVRSSIHINMGIGVKK